MLIYVLSSKSPSPIIWLAGELGGESVSDSVYSLNSKGGSKAGPVRYPETAIWSAYGEFVRAAYTQRKDDDDFFQPGILVREVLDDAQRHRLVSNMVGNLKNDVSEPLLERAFRYWRNIDKEIGERIAKGVKC